MALEIRLDWKIDWKSKMAGQSVSGFNDLSSSTNGSDSTKRLGTPQITPSELSRPANLQRIAQRKAQIKTYPIRKKLEKLGVYSSCKASMEHKSGFERVLLLDCMF